MVTDSVVSIGDGLRREQQHGGALFLVLAVVLFMLGVGVFSYPMVADWLSDMEHTEVIANQNSVVSQQATDQLQVEWDAALAYNENLVSDPVHDPFVAGSRYTRPANYEEILNVNKDGVMGDITIPKINVDLPIYHGIGDEALAKGVGHIVQTALPVGGKGYRSLLTGHRGLPSALLFTRLDELEKGDEFVISVLDKQLVYDVVQIETIRPNEVGRLRPVPGRDLVSLVTCTPYGVNTRRLIVTGERADRLPGQKRASQSRGSKFAELFPKPLWFERLPWIVRLSIFSGGTTMLAILEILMMVIAVRRLMPGVRARHADESRRRSRL